MRLDVLAVWALLIGIQVVPSIILFIKSKKELWFFEWIKVLENCSLTFSCITLVLDTWTLIIIITQNMQMSFKTIQRVKRDIYLLGINMNGSEALRMRMHRDYHTESILITGDSRSYSQSSLKKAVTVLDG